MHSSTYLGTICLRWYSFLWFSHSSLFLPMIKQLKIHGGRSLRHYQQLNGGGSLRHYQQLNGGGSLRHYQQLSCYKNFTDFKNPEIYSHVQKGSSGVPHLRPINLANILPPYLFNINFNVTVLSTSTFPEKKNLLFSFSCATVARRAMSVRV
jgi:hypothetical protein